MERRTYQGNVYTRNGPGEEWRLSGPAGGPPQAGQPIMVKPRNINEQRTKGAQATQEEVQASVDSATQGDAIRKAAADAQKAEADARNAALETQLKGLEIQLSEATGGMTPKDANEMRMKRAQIQSFINQINHVQGLLNETVNKTSGLGGIRDYLPSSQNAAVDAASAGLAEQGMAAFRVPGVGSQSDTELKQFVEANKPSRMSFDSANSERLRTLRNRAEQTMQALGMESPQWVPEIRDSASSGSPQQRVATTRGGERVPVPELQGLEQEVIDRIRQGQSSDEIAGYLGRRYQGVTLPNGGGLNVDAGMRDFLDTVIAKHKANPQADIGGLASGWDMLTGYETPVQDATTLGNIQEGIAPFFGNAANAATFGAGADLAGLGGVLDVASENAPVSSFLGDMAGSGAALAGLGVMAPVRGLGFINKGGGLGGDLAYSTARGAIEGGPMGAAIGFGSGLVGDAAGRGIGQVARRSGATGGPARPSTAMRLVGKEVDDVDPIVAALTQGRDIDVPLNVADVATRLTPMAGAAYRRSDWQTQDDLARALTDRSMNQGARYTEAIERNLGPLGSPEAAQQSLMAQARMDSDPLYEAFRTNPPATSPVIDQVLSTKAGQSALGRAGNIAEMEGLPPLDYEAGIAVSPATLDLVKRGFDDELYNSSIPTSGIGKAELGALGNMRGRYVNELDALFPNYAEARAAYGGPASIASAMDEGMGALKVPPRQIPDVIGGYNPSQLEAYRFGARQSLADKAAGVVDTADPWRSGLGAPASRERVAAIFGDDPAKALADQLEMERAMNATKYATIGNSATAGRLAADEKMSGDIMSEMGANAAIDMATGGAPVSTGLGLANRFLKDRASLGFSGAREEVASDLSNFLLKTDADVSDIARALAEAVEYEKFAQEVRRKAAMGGTSITNASIATSGAYN